MSGASDIGDDHDSVVFGSCCKNIFRPVKQRSWRRCPQTFECEDPVRARQPEVSGARPFIAPCVLRALRDPNRFPGEKESIRSGLAHVGGDLFV